MASANGVSNTIANLADVSEFQDGIIQKTLQEAQIQRQHAWAINNTIQTLVLGLSPSEWPRFATQALTLVPSKGPLPDQDALKQTYDLACASNTHATSQLVGSLLVGPGSESDEYADVGFWCGEIDEANKEISILRSLSLGAWAEKGTMTKLDIAPLTALRKSEMWELCAALRDLIEFRVGRPDSDGRVIHIMAGKGSGGWCGLIGVGVWSDIEE